jgi:hypothetical protein
VGGGAAAGAGGGRGGGAASRMHTSWRASSLHMSCRRASHSLLLRAEVSRCSTSCRQAGPGGGGGVQQGMGARVRWRRAPGAVLPARLRPLLCAPSQPGSHFGCTRVLCAQRSSSCPPPSCRAAWPAAPGCVHTEPPPPCACPCSHPPPAARPCSQQARQHARCEDCQHCQPACNHRRQDAAAATQGRARVTNETDCAGCW